jgi:hypothetical protein
LGSEWGWVFLKTNPTGGAKVVHIAGQLHARNCTRPVPRTLTARSGPLTARPRTAVDKAAWQVKVVARCWCSRWPGLASRRWMYCMRPSRCCGSAGQAARGAQRPLAARTRCSTCPRRRSNMRTTCKRAAVRGNSVTWRASEANLSKVLVPAPSSAPPCAGQTPSSRVSLHIRARLSVAMVTRSVHGRPFLQWRRHSGATH